MNLARMAPPAGTPDRALTPARALLVGPAQTALRGSGTSVLTSLASMAELAR